MNKIIPIEKDRRVKLTDADRARIKDLHAEGNTSIRALARLYGVDKRTIQFLLFPERLEKNLADRAVRGGSTQYYEVSAHRVAMREYRRHMNALGIRKPRYEKKVSTS